MTIENLKTSIGFQIGFLLHSGKSVESTIENLKAIAIDYANQFEPKAQKWDALDSKISKCYIDDNGDELSQEQSENIDLGTIGEIAAVAFGYL